MAWLHHLCREARKNRSFSPQFEETTERIRLHLVDMGVLGNRSHSKKIDDDLNLAGALVLAASRGQSIQIPSRDKCKLHMLGLSDHKTLTFLDNGLDQRVFTNSENVKHPKSFHPSKTIRNFIAEMEYSQ